MFGRIETVIGDRGRSRTGDGGRGGTSLCLGRGRVGVGLLVHRNWAISADSTSPASLARIDPQYFHTFAAGSEWPLCNFHFDRSKFPCTSWTGCFQPTAQWKSSAQQGSISHFRVLLWFLPSLVAAFLFYFEFKGESRGSGAPVKWYYLAEIGAGRRSQCTGTPHFELKGALLGELCSRRIVCLGCRPETGSLWSIRYQMNPWIRRSYKKQILE